MCTCVSIMVWVCALEGVCVKTQWCGRMGRRGSPWVTQSHRDPICSLQGGGEARAGSEEGEGEGGGTPL